MNAVLWIWGQVDGQVWIRIFCCNQIRIFVIVGMFDIYDER